jgi:hypothetical protein
MKINLDDQIRTRDGQSNFGKVPGVGFYLQMPLFVVFTTL